jgi:hypothetical protein
MQDRPSLKAPFHMPAGKIRIVDLAFLPPGKRQEYTRNWLRRGESNSWSLDYRSSALNQLSYSAMEPKSGIEPLTCCVPGRCSSN